MSTSAGLEVEVRDPDRGVDVSFVVPGGQTTALLGPNGTGKSTVLATIAGVHRPAGSSVLLDGRRLDHLPPHRRRVALLSQDPLLLPHLSALDDVAFGPRAGGASRRAARASAARWLERVGAGHLADRRPGTLSGGQAARVALARALAAKPDVVLLDEPLSALDVDAAPQVRHVLREVLRGRTAVVVTHDVVDAALLADHAVVVDGGRVVEQGPVRDLVSTPRSPFAARLAGVNLVSGVLGPPGELRTPGGVLHGLPVDAPEGTRAVATFRPETVAVHRRPPGGSPRNVVAGTVVSVEPSGSAARLRATTDLGALVADLTPAAVADLGLGPGETVHLVVKAAAVRLDTV